jgi:spermidine synthase
VTRPWRTLARVDTAEGPLELRARGERDFLIVVGGRVLMTSAAHRSEEALATRALTGLRAPAPRVLIGGLGMGFTLRAALDALPATARVRVVELNPVVVAWCRGPLAPLTGAAVDDPRVEVEVADVAHAIATAPAGALEAILLDLYEGPFAVVKDPDDPWFGRGALARARAALAPGGVLAVWSEEPCPPFARLLAAAGFALVTDEVRGGGRRHVVYLGTRP